MVISRQYLPAQESITDRYALGYLDAVSEYAALFTGKRPQPLNLFIRNHQYFKDEKFVSGRLSFGGVVYPDVLLRWDLYRDEIVVLSPDNHDIALKKENVGFAEVHGYHIFYLRPDHLIGCPPVGYYIRLYSGEYLLLEKLTVNLFRDVTQRGRFVYEATLSTNFFLLKDGEYFKINSRRTLLKFFDSHHAELKQFIHTNKFKYKHDAERMVLEVVKQHEKLSRL